ncbi:hypothetical protein GRF29_1g1289136 [Pseudopithomyces chartarum]|uniref:Proteasome assembly chaperone 3 n=1 Tax=Pseudopithomyces chartarum TaxID=1892770 RepID=A0AAN6RMP3_9PLEO|nr:hypothetical protein GRF29_1g1289136 [Pseudopithomyces chartarum]
MSTAPPAYNVTPAPFPAPGKTSTATIASHPTTASTLYFADKIVITVTQNGRLAHWTHVPLDLSATDSTLTHQPSFDHSTSDDPPSDLLPLHHLTATTILGGTNADIDVLASTLATTLASAIKTRNERELRTVVLGTGLDKSMGGRAEFSELVGLVLDVL